MADAPDGCSLAAVTRPTEPLTDFKYHAGPRSLASRIAPLDPDRSRPQPAPVQLSRPVHPMASIRSLAATAALFGSVMASPAEKRALPSLAQVINQKSFNVLPTVPTAEEYNASSVSTGSRNLRRSP